MATDIRLGIVCRCDDVPGLPTYSGAASLPDGSYRVAMVIEGPMGPQVIESLAFEVPPPARPPGSIFGNMMSALMTTIMAPVQYSRSTP